MKEKSLLQQFIKYVSLNVCGMLGLSGYILADTFFIANGLGANGLTALNLAIPIYSFVHGSGLMFGMGGATKYAIFRGQKDKKNANQVFITGIFLAIGLALLFMFLSIFAGNLASLLGADSAVYAMTKTYIRLILLFAPAFMMNDVLICFVRNDGSPQLSMLAMLGGSIANIILDYIFIFPLQMGIFGAVLATGFAPIISMGILSKHWITKKNNFHLQKNRLTLNLSKQVVALGIPSLVAEVASGIVIIVFNFLILGLAGNVGVAAYGVIANLSLVVTAIYTGIAQGAQPLMSKAYGYGRREDIRIILGYAIKVVLVLSACIYVAFYFQSNAIVGIFNNGKNMQLQQMAMEGFRLYFTAIPFAGMNIVLAMYFTSTERALPAQAISLSRGLFVIVPVSFLLAFLLQMTGVWLAYLVTESIVFLMALFFYRPST